MGADLGSGRINRQFLGILIAQIQGGIRTEMLTRDNIWPKARPFTIQLNSLGVRNPLVVAVWSAILPGFGHTALGKYLTGFILIAWEMLVNTKTQLNVVILYTFTGRFAEAQQAVDLRWFGFYVSLYVFTIWDSYRTAVDINKISILAERASRPIAMAVIGFLEISYIEKRSPWVAMLWSALMPGTGHLYAHRLPTALIILGWWIACAYHCHYLEALHFTVLGDFARGTAVLDPQWFLFMPSIYSYGIYYSYVHCVEYNKLFDDNQAAYLREEYAAAPGKLP